MKATIATTYGDPNVIEINKMINPLPTVYEVLLKLESSSEIKRDTKIKSVDNIYNKKLATNTLWGYHVLTFLH